MTSSEKTLVCCAAWCLALAGAVVASACSGGESADPVDSTEPDAAAPEPDAGDPPDGDAPEAEAGPDAAPDAPTDAPDVEVSCSLEQPLGAAVDASGRLHLVAAVRANGTPEVHYWVF